MELIDEILVEKYAIETGSNEVPHITDQYSHGLKVGIEFGIEKGVDFAEQQLKQKMIEAIDWAFKNYHSFDGIIVPINTNDILKFKTTEQLLEEFINQQTKTT